MNDTPNPTESGAAQIIQPPNRLRNRVRMIDGGMDDAVARAEKALEALSGEFRSWMDAESDALTAARDASRTDGLTSGPTSPLYRVAHDIRGQAATLGFPLAGRVGDSLCRLLDSVPAERIPAVLVDQHVDAIRAIVAENASGEGTGVARTLVERLVSVTWEFVEAELGRAP